MKKKGWTDRRKEEGRTEGKKESFEELQGLVQRELQFAKEQLHLCLLFYLFYPSSLAHSQPEAATTQLQQVPGNFSPYWLLSSFSPVVLAELQHALNT